MTIHSPKTEHHPSGEQRIVPIFPELRPYLEEVWEQAEPGTEYVITRYRDSNVNLRTQRQRIILKAGLKPWPKLLQKLWSSRQTELVRQFPEHVACAWIGNSRPVAVRHYLQITEDHYRQATEQPTEPAESALRNPVQCAHVSDGTAKEAPSENPIFPEGYIPLPAAIIPPIAAVGLEPTTRGL